MITPRRLQIAGLIVVIVGGSTALVARAATRPAHHQAASSTSSRPAATTSTVRATTVPPTTAAPTTVPRSTTTASTSTTTTTAAPATTTTVAATAPSHGSGSLAAVAGKTIVIDAGHNGGNASHASEINRPIFIGTGYRACDTTGTETNGGYTEHAYTLDVALRVQAILQGAGAHVVMTRTNDSGVGPCIDERAYIGNRAHAAVGISIHADGGPAGGRGFCVYMPALTRGYTDDIYAASHRLGVDLRDAYAADSGIPAANYVCSAGLAEANNYGGLNLSNVPKVLFETANMRNATDASLLVQPSARQRIAQGIAAGLARFLAG